MTDKINPEAYLAEAVTLFSSGRISLDSIKQFIAFENLYKMHQNPQYRQKYTEIFSHIREKVVFFNFQKEVLIEFFEGMSILYRNSGIILPKSEKGNEIIRAIVASFDKNDNYHQFFLLRMIFVIKTFNNEPFKEEFLEKITMFPSAGCFKSVQAIQALSNYLRQHFTEAEPFMQVLKERVFNDSFDKRHIMQKKAGIMWVVEVFWNMTFKEHPAHLVLIDKWIDILNKAMEDKQDELVFYMHFPLSHLYLNNCREQHEFKVFTDRVEIPFSRYIAANAERWGLKPNNKPKAEGKKKIAFVYERLVGNSIVKLLISLLTYLSKENYELYLYDMAVIEKAVSMPEYIEAVKETGTKYVNNHELINDADLGHYYSHFNKCMKLREKMVSDGIDIMIFTGNKAQSAFLASTRTAPKQFFWDHGNHEYDTLNIDKRICHFDDGYRNGFEVERFKLSLLDKYLNPETDGIMEQAEKIKASLPKHKVILGSIGRIMKLSDEYIETVAEILRLNPEAIYLACGTGPVEDKRKKTQELGISDRFIFTGWVDPHVYGHVIDVYLNTFPLVGGESVNEFVSKGENKYVVTLQ